MLTRMRWKSGAWLGESERRLLESRPRHNWPMPERWTELSDDDLWHEREAYERWVAAGGAEDDPYMPLDAFVWSMSLFGPIVVRHADGVIGRCDKEGGVHRLWDESVV